jgi:hypothetical protein
MVLSGYEIERHDFVLGNASLELPPVQLQVSRGTLMLTSLPSGAAIMINGKHTEYSTPAQIRLTPGVYTVTIEKDGRQASETIEITRGITTRRMVIGQ